MKYLLVDRKTGDVTGAGEIGHISLRDNEKEFTLFVGDIKPGFWSVDMSKVGGHYDIHDFSGVCIPREPTKDEIASLAIDAVGRVEEQTDRILSSIVGNRSVLRGKKLADAEQLLLDADAPALFVRYEADAIGVPVAVLAQQIVAAAKADDAILAEIEALRRAAKLSIQNATGIRAIKAAEAAWLSRIPSLG